MPVPAPSPPSAGEGLYDLPGLLARIWSVPATQLARSGSYTARSPTPPPPPAAVGERRPAAEAPVASAPLPWSLPSLEETASLPLAAVPSLAFDRFGERARPPPPAGPTVGPPPVVPWHPALQYVAWRHPPCRMAYAPGLLRAARSLRGGEPPVAGTVLRSAGTMPHRAFGPGPWIRPASPAWMHERAELLGPLSL